MMKLTNTDHFLSGKDLSHGECLYPAMKITDEADAKNYLSAYVAYLTNFRSMPIDEAYRVALSNIGYFAGYFDAETVERTQRLFGAIHPVFGKEVFEDKEE